MLSIRNEADWQAIFRACAEDERGAPAPHEEEAPRGEAHDSVDSESDAPPSFAESDWAEDSRASSHEEKEDEEEEAAHRKEVSRMTAPRANNNQAHSATAAGSEVVSPRERREKIWTRKQRGRQFLRRRGRQFLRQGGRQFPRRRRLLLGIWFPLLKVRLRPAHPSQGSG